MAKSSGRLLALTCFFIGTLIGRVTLVDNLSVSKDWIEVQHVSAVPRVVPDPNKLHVAWLMSFPNSGTSYTMALVASATLISAGTNYGQETGGELRNMFNSTLRREAPYWKPSDELELTRPTKGFILTKTHCGGRCFNCRPHSAFLVSKEMFLMHCLRYTRETNEQLLNLVYSMDVVKKAVHLIRDPMDNVISRYHHMRHLMDEEKQKKYPNNVDGFRAFCHDVVDQTSLSETFVPYIPKYIWGPFTTVPCFTDFLRYVRWHNFAFAITSEHGLPVHLMHYEDYEKDWNTTVDGLLNFLGQPLHPDAEPELFSVGKTYREYYTSQEVKTLKFCLERLASKATWSQISHYFR